MSDDYVVFSRFFNVFVNKTPIHLQVHVMINYKERIGFVLSVNITDY